MRTITILLALSSGLWAQTKLPDTPAGVVFSAWLQASNSGDRSRVQAYVDQYEQKHKENMEMMLGLQSRVGGFDLLKIDSIDRLHLVALLKERIGGNWARADFELADASSMQVKGMELGLVPPPPDASANAPAAASAPAAGRKSQQEAIEALDSKAAEAAGQDTFSGAVLVASHGDIQLEKAYGKADRERNQANTADTKFRLGSMNKMFTATAILQLVGQGKIDLAAPVGQYLKGYPNSEIATKVTVRHLLTHTGGTGDVFTAEYLRLRLEIRDPKDYIRLFGSRGPEFAPGTKWSYSNYGFILLGAIVESVSGISYYDYVRKNIFGPAGMTSTDSLPEKEVAAKLSANLAKGYLGQPGAWKDNVAMLPARGTPAGGGYSTVRDLYRFAEALMAGKLIQPELLQAMTSKQASGARMPAGNAYGFGMIVSENPRRFGHGGGAPGMNGELRVYPASRSVVVVLANLDPPVATQLADFYEQVMPAQ